MTRRTGVEDENSGLPDETELATDQQNLDLVDPTTKHSSAGGGNMNSSNVFLYGNMDWFQVAEQPASFDSLPPVFQQAYEMWVKNNNECTKEIIELLSPFVFGRFVTENICDWDKFFDEENYGEFESTKVNVAGVDFSVKPIPLCKVEGWFTVKLKGNVSTGDIEAHLEASGALLSDCLVFYWSFEENEELEDLDLTVGDHSGAEAIFTEDNKA